MNEFYRDIFSQRNKALELCQLYKDGDENKRLQYYKIDLYSQLLNIAYRNISKPDELPEVFNISSKYFISESFIKYLLEEIHISSNITTIFHRSYSTGFSTGFKVSLIDTSFQKEDQTSIENNVLEGFISIRNWYTNFSIEQDKYKNVIDVYARLLNLVFTNYSNPDQFSKVFSFDDVGIDFNDFYFHMEKVLEFTKNFDIEPNIKLIHSWSSGTGIPPHSFDYFVELENKKRA